MLRTLIDCTRVILESPWLMLLGFVVVVLPGGLLLMPVLASRLRRAKAAMPEKGSHLSEPFPANHSYRTATSDPKSNLISFVPSVGKLH